MSASTGLAQTDGAMEEASLEAHAECSTMRQEFGRQRQPAIWFRRRQDGKSNLSKLGGRPTLPPDIDWPRHGQTGTPLHFLSQIDLSSLPPTPLHNAPRAPTLPKRGLLFFF